MDRPINAPSQQSTGLRPALGVVRLTVIGWPGYLASLLERFKISVPYALSMAPIAGDGFDTLRLTGAIMNRPATVPMAILQRIGENRKGNRRSIRTPFDRARPCT